MTTRYLSGVAFLRFCCIIVFMFSTLSMRASKVWAERLLGEMSIGYEPDNNRTLINQVVLVAFGPDSIDKEAESFVKGCVSAGLSAGYDAYCATPGEVSVKLGAAWVAFKVSIGGCISLAGFANAYVSQFEIGVQERQHWVPGLNLLLDVNNPSVEINRKVHGFIAKYLPDQANKIISLYINSAEIPKVDVKIDVPDEFQRYLPSAKLPTGEDLERYKKELLSRSPAALANAAQNEFQNYDNKAKKAVEQLQKTGEGVLTPLGIKVPNFTLGGGMTLPDLGADFAKNVLKLPVNVQLNHSGSKFEVKIADKRFEFDVVNGTWLGNLKDGARVELPGGGEIKMGVNENGKGEVSGPGFRLELP